MSAASFKYKKHRRRLWKKRGGLCHWCGIKTVLPERCLIPGQPYPSYMATLDHVRSKWDGGNHSRKSTEGTVLSCLKCNHERAAESMSAHACRLAEVQAASDREGARLLAKLSEERT